MMLQSLGGSTLCVAYVVAILIAVGSVASMSCAGVPQAGAAEVPDPPLERLEAKQGELPRPFPPFGTLGETERVLVAAALSQTLAPVTTTTATVWILPDRFLVLVNPSDLRRAEDHLRPLFAVPDDLSVEAGARTMTILNPIGPNSVRSDLVLEGHLHYKAIWDALINSFPKICGIEIDAASHKKDLARSHFSFRSEDRRVPSSRAFDGVIIKERIRLELQDASQAQHQSAELIVVHEIFWRRSSQNTWHQVKSKEHLDLAMVAQGAKLGISECKEGILTEILRE